MYSSRSSAYSTRFQLKLTFEPFSFDVDRNLKLELMHMIMVMISIGCRVAAISAAGVVAVAAVCQRQEPWPVARKATGT